MSFQSFRRGTAGVVSCAVVRRFLRFVLPLIELYSRAGPENTCGRCALGSSVQGAAFVV